MLDELLVERHILCVNALFLIEEVTVKTIPFCKLDQFFSNNEVAFFVLFKQGVHRLAGAVVGVEVYAAHGQNAVLVGSVGVGRVGHIDSAELKVALRLPAVASCVVLLVVAVPDAQGRVGHSSAVPGAVVVHILPEVKHVLAELVVVSGALIKGIAVVAGHVHHLYIGAELGVCLGGSIGVDVFLEGDLSPHQIGIGVGFRAPVFQVDDPVTSKQRLVSGDLGVVLVRPGVCRGSCREAHAHGRHH